MLSAQIMHRWLDNTVDPSRISSSWLSTVIRSLVWRIDVSKSIIAVIKSAFAFLP